MSVTPKKRILYRYAVDIFVALLKQVQYRVKEYRCNDQDVRAWNTFVDYYSNTNIGEDFIRKFAEYGIQSWFNPDMTEIQKHRCRFAWIFGAAAIKRWNALGMDANVRLTRIGLRSKFEIKGKKIESQLSSAYSSVRVSEERLKQGYYNRKRGLDWCIANTTLFFHKSPLCASCIYKIDCKKILKVNYPKIYKLRGYD